MATISQLEINGTTYDILDANTKDALGQLNTRVTSLESSVDTTNIVSVTRVATTVTTSATGNIATGCKNDGFTAVVAPHVSGATVYLRAYVSGANGLWFLTAVDPNAGTTINNINLNIRYWVVKFKRA